jgi:hypothetical protein
MWRNPLASSASCFIPAVVRISNKIIIYLEQKYWDWEDLLAPRTMLGDIGF